MEKTTLFSSAKRLMMGVCLCGFICLALPSCGIFSSETEVNQAAVDATPETGIYIYINTVMGKTGPSIHTTDGYYIRIKDGKARSYLPFFGEVYYGGGFGTTSGIVFEDCPVDIQETVKKNGVRSWSFTGTMQQNEKVEVTIEFGESGYATITCHSTNRSLMRYMGEVVTPPEEKESTAETLVDYFRNMKSASQNQ